MMNPNMSFFMQSAHGFQPFAQGLPPQMATGFEGLPIIGQHPVFQMLAQPALQQLMAGQGMTPFGFGPVQNQADIMRHRQFMIAQQQIAAQGGQLDQENMMRIVRGGYHAANKPFTPEAQRMWGASIQAFDQYMMPALAMSHPGLADDLMGGKGSQRVLGMNLAAMNRYRVDPVTGRLGMDPQSTVAMASGLAGLAGSSSVYGLRTGELGSAANALHQMGLLGGPTGTTRDRAFDVLGGFSQDQLKAIGGRQGVDMSGGVGKLTAADIDKLTLDPAVSDRIRSLDVNRTIRVVKEYSGALKAMGEIFAEMGRPGTGALEQIQGLQQLTGGMVGRLDPKSLGLLARQNFNTMRDSGLTPDEWAMMQQHASNTAHAMGLVNPGMFGQEATANAAAFMRHYTQTNTWQGADRIEAGQRRMNLELAGATSNIANRAGLLARINKTVGGFQAGSAAAAMMEAMNAGRDTFVDPATGQIRSIDMEDSAFREMVLGAKGADGENLRINERQLDAMLQQRDVNAEFSSKGGYGKLTAGSQRREVANFLGMRLGSTMADLANQAGGDIDAETGQTMATNVMRSLNELGQDVKRNPAQRQAALVKIIEKEMRDNGLGTQLDGMSAGDRQKFLAMAAEDMFGGADQAIKTSRFRGTIGSMEKYLDVLGSNETETNADAMRFKNRVEAETQDAAAGATPSGGPLARVVDNIKAGMPGGMTGLLGTMFGGVDASKTKNWADKRVGEMDQLKRAIDAEMSKVNAMPEGPAKKAAMAALDAKRSHLTQLQAETKGISETAAKTMAQAESEAKQGDGGGFWDRLTKRMTDPTGQEKAPQPKPADNSPAGELHLRGKVSIDFKDQTMSMDSVTAGAPNSAAASP